MSMLNLWAAFAHNPANAHRRRAFLFVVGHEKIIDSVNPSKKIIL